MIESVGDYRYFGRKAETGGAGNGMSKQVVPLEIIENRIFLIRGLKVMLSSDLAELYGVQPKVMIQAVKRNIERFPEDFMFQLTKSEYSNLKSQNVTSSGAKRPGAMGPYWGGLRRATPYAFTEQGVSMLSSVLRSKQAVQVNIQIMRAFVKLRTFLSTHKELAEKLQDLEKKYDTDDPPLVEKMTNDSGTVSRASRIWYPATRIRYLVSRIPYLVSRIPCPLATNE